MTSTMVDCPHCQQPVVFAADGICPACHQRVKIVDVHPGESVDPVLASQIAAQQQQAAEANHEIATFFQTLAGYTPQIFVTKAIIGLNILVFLAMVATGVSFMAPAVQDAIDWGANFGPKTLNGQWWRLATCMFLHFGVIHLAFNMYILWSIGPLVERLFGHVGYAVLYLAAGVAGSLASLAWNPVAVSAGASGAVFGVAGALLGLITLRRHVIPPAVLAILQKNIVSFLVVNGIYGFVASRIDMAAHIGGLAGGFIAALILAQPVSPEMLKGRMSRNAVALGVAAVVLPLAAFALPDAPIDVRAELREFIELERRVIDAHNDLVERFNRREINEAEFADAVDEDVLKPWQEGRFRMEKAVQSPHADRDQLDRIVEYIEVREDSWRLRIEAIRENSVEKQHAANEAWERAEQLARESS